MIRQQRRLFSNLLSQTRKSPRRTRPPEEPWVPGLYKVPEDASEEEAAHIKRLKELNRTQKLHRRERSKAPKRRLTKGDKF